MKIKRIQGATLALATLTCGGCIGFGGPSGIARSIETSCPEVDLTKREAISVGPLGILTVQVFASAYLPMDISGVHTVSWGSYDVNELSSGGFSLRDVELDGWERVARICEDEEEMILLVRDNDSMNGVVVLEYSGDTVEIIRVRGNIGQILENAFESDFLDGLDLSITSHDIAPDLDEKEIRNEIEQAVREAGDAVDG